MAAMAAPDGSPSRAAAAPGGTKREQGRGQEGRCERGEQQDAEKGGTALMLEGWHGFLCVMWRTFRGDHEV